MAGFVIPAIALGTTLLGTAMQMRGQLEQGEAALKSANFNASLTEQAGLQEEQLIRRSGRRSESTMRASIAKSGVTMEGSPLEAIAQNAANFEIDALNTRYNSQMSARIERVTGQRQNRAARISAATTLFNGLTSVASSGRTMGMF